MRPLARPALVLATAALLASAGLGSGVAFAAVPAAPATNGASATDTSLSFLWQLDPAADSYEYSFDGGAWTPAAYSVYSGNIVRQSTPFTGLLGGTRHVLALRAINTDGTGPATEVEATTSGLPDPTGITPSATVSPRDTSCTLTLDKGDWYPIGSVQLEYSIDGGAWAYGAGSGGGEYGDPLTVESLTVNGLDNGVAYSLRGRIANTAGTASNPSNAVTCTPQPAPAAPVAGTVTFTPDGTGATLTWGASATGSPTSYYASAYNVDPIYGLEDGYGQDVTTAAGVLTATFTAMTPGVLYQFDVNATNAYGDSAIVSLTGTAPGVAPSAPVVPAPAPNPAPDAPAPPPVTPPAQVVTPTPVDPTPPPVTPTTPAPAPNPALMPQPTTAKPLIGNGNAPGSVTIPSVSKVTKLIAGGQLTQGTFINPASPYPGKAPVASVPANSTVRMTVRGLPKNADALIRIRSASSVGWSSLGQVRADANGMLTLPALTLTSGSYSLRIMPGPAENRRFDLYVGIDAG